MTVATFHPELLAATGGQVELRLLDPSGQEVSGTLMRVQFTAAGEVEYLVVSPPAPGVTLVVPLTSVARLLIRAETG